MSDKITCTYKGLSQVHIQVDEVADVLYTAHDDKKEFVTPGDMLVSALGACTLTMMSVVAEKSGEKLDGAQITLTPTFGPNLSGLQAVELHIVFPENISEATKKKCLIAAEKCPVHRSLNPAIKFTVTSN